MSEFHKMSIDKLQEELSKAVHGSGISPAEAILHSKTIMFLSNEIAILKESLCMESERMQKSNEKLARSQSIHSQAIIILTALLVFVGVAQSFIAYSTLSCGKTTAIVDGKNQ